MSNKSLQWTASAAVATLAAVVACFWLAPDAACARDEAMIGVAWDANGEVCNLNEQPGQQGWLYVLAYARGLAAFGFTGAELRVDGFPAEWYVASITPHPEASVSIGNPLGGGSNIAFAHCMVSPAPIVLYTVHFFTTSAVTARVVSVTHHATPSNPNMPCPLFVACDGPCQCEFCVAGGAAAINDPGFCTTAVEATSWSRVRSLYE